MKEQQASPRGSSFTVFDLLPFLRLRFGQNLRPELESVSLVFNTEYPLLLETTHRDNNGNRVVKSEEACLALPSGMILPHQVVRAYIDLDAFGWLNVGEIFAPGIDIDIEEGKEIESNDRMELEEIEIDILRMIQRGGCTDIPTDQQDSGHTRWLYSQGYISDGTEGDLVLTELGHQVLALQEKRQR